MSTTLSSSIITITSPVARPELNADVPSLIPVITTAPAISRHVTFPNAAHAEQQDRGEVVQGMASGQRDDGDRTVGVRPDRNSYVGVNLHLRSSRNVFNHALYAREQAQGILGTPQAHARHFQGHVEELQVGTSHAQEAPRHRWGRPGARRPI